MPAEILTVFEVIDGGTLQMVDCDEAQSRAEFCEGAADQWGSPQGLLDAADECQPLAWAVSRIYADFRDELVADIETASIAARQNRKRITPLKTLLKKLPEEPLDGLSHWLLSLTTSESGQQIGKRKPYLQPHYQRLLSCF